MKLSSGFVLFEVLIATLILAIGLFGIIGIYINSFKSMGSSYQRTLEVSKTIVEHEKLSATLNAHSRF